MPINDINPMLYLSAAMVLLTFLFSRIFKPRHLWRRRAAKRVMSKLQEIEGFGPRLAYLRKIDPFVFEELVLEGFERRGCKVQRNKRYTGDGGIDGRFWIKGNLYLVQAKRYSGHVSAAHLRDFCRLIDKQRCRGIFVHTGRTGKMTREIGEAHAGVSIVSGEKLLQLVSPNNNSHSRPS